MMNIDHLSEAELIHSALHIGSLVLDVNGGRLDAKMIRETGAIDDYFSIVKNLPNTAPTVSVTSPVEGATFIAPATITVTANASDSDGTIAQVDFCAGTTLIGATTTAPYTVTWNNVAAGSYTLTAAATDNLGATTSSAAVHITVNGPPPPTPAAPTNLTAAAVSQTQISLAWADNSGNEVGFQIERGINANSFTQIAEIGRASCRERVCLAV